MTSKLTIKKAVRKFSFLWNTLLVAGLFTFLVRYKLDFGRYFLSVADISNLSAWHAFLSEKSDTLTLGAVCLVSFVMLTRDSGKWQEIGEGCFSTLATPAQWERVHGRHVFTWVILSNIAIFLALPLFADWLVPFCALLAVHHLNAVAWIVYLRRNMQHYFVHPQYAIPETDIHKPFIERQRKTVVNFMIEESHVARHIIVVAACMIAISIAVLSSTEELILRTTSYIVLVAGVLVNEYLAFFARLRRDRSLDEIRTDWDEFDKQRE